MSVCKVFASVCQKFSFALNVFMFFIASICQSSLLHWMSSRFLKWQFHAASKISYIIHHCNLCTCDPAAMEAEFPSSVGSIAVGGNSPSIGVWISFLFFLIRIHSMQGWTTTTKHGNTRKRSTKRLKHRGNLLRKNLQLIGVC